MVSHYRVTEQLGKGGMGVVYKAHDTNLDREVALKFLAPGAVTDTERKRFVKEAQSAASIHHPNICPIYEIGEHQGQLFFAMALVDGKTISENLLEGPLPFDAALDIAIQVAAGLDRAHRHGVVHRDIKSANIIVEADGHVSILDFGVAQRQGRDRLTETGAAVGTPVYMSPEQAQGLPVDHRSDLWSLAVVLFEMLTGVLPFRGNSQYSVLHAIVTEDPRSVSSARPGVPERLAQFIHKALAKDPDDRWQSAAEMAEQLRQIRRAPATDTQTMRSYVAERAGAARAPAAWHKRVSVFAVSALLTVAAIVFGVGKVRSRYGLPAEKRIAVLPFAVVGNDPSVQPLADGLMETLTSKLSQIDDFQGKLMVVPASEVRGRNIKSAEAALRIYGANLVITGSAQRWGDRIQFTMNIVDAANVRQIASRTFDYEEAQLIALRDGAVNGAVQLLALKISPKAGESLTAGETEVPSAYEEYLKGAGYLARYDLPGNLDRAIASLTQAVQIDPGYARALAALGQAHWRKAVHGSSTVEAQLALDNIQNAIRLDSHSVQARVKLGEIYSESGRPDEAIRELDRVLHTAPHNAEAYRALGQARGRAAISASRSCLRASGPGTPDGLVCAPYARAVLFPPRT
jgi:TolB-like protein/predicted Ser/Thr protein kinase